MGDFDLTPRQFLGAIVGGILGFCVVYTLLATFLMFANGKVG